MVSEAEVLSAYNRYAVAMERHYMATVILAEAKTTLETARAEGLANGSIEGKNAELREASAREQLKDRYTALEIAQTAEQQAGIELRLAGIHVEKLRLIVRIQELAVRTAPEN